MVHDLLNKAALRNPNHVAVIHKGRSTTYKDLNENAEYVCSHLLRAGIQKGDRVLLLWDNGAEYVSIFFGILMAGGVVVPLNPTNTKESVRYSAFHSGASYAAVTDRAITLVIEWWEGKDIITDSPGRDGCIALETILECAEGGEKNRYASIPVWPDDLALILYTSGTTGNPKGVMLTHRNMEANTRSILGYLTLLPNDRTLAILPFYYSYGNSMLLTHVSAGATLIVENGFAFVKRALDTMRRQEVTGFSGVPSHYSILIHRSKFLESTWPSLRYMTCAGGGLPPAHVRKIRDALPQVELHLMYGQTEGAARLSSLSPDLVDEKAGSVGTGIPGIELRVVKKDGSEVGAGDVGELIARGENIMAGYLDDSAGTGEVLRNGWLYTGDLATVDEEGFIYIKGRAKEIIKSGGYRISPQQIEETLLQYPAVLECVVVGVPDEIMGEVIVAFVVWKPERREESAPIFSFAREKLPHYMVPGRIETIDTIPKTDSGKVQRYLLRESAIPIITKERTSASG